MGAFEGFVIVVKWQNSVTTCLVYASPTGESFLKCLDVTAVPLVKSDWHDQILKQKMNTRSEDHHITKLTPPVQYKVVFL